MSRGALRRLGFGLATLAGAPRGWFIPHRHAAAALAPDRYAALEPCFAAALPTLRARLAEAAAFLPDLARFGGPPPAPRFAQDWFPRLDAAIAYAELRQRPPARVIEIGSGHSTRVLARAIADGGLSTRLTAIDPAPRADLAGLDIALIRAPVQRAPAALFATLAAGDILMIDSSHVLMPGSDVDLLFNTVLPALPAGVRVHIHDIFLPDAYPRAWSWRGYNEQNALAGLLTGGGWTLGWSSRYVVTRLAAELAASPLAGLPLPRRAVETSLWLARA